MLATCRATDPTKELLQYECYWSNTIFFCSFLHMWHSMNKKKQNKKILDVIFVEKLMKSMLLGRRQLLLQKQFCYKTIQLPEAVSSLYRDPLEWLVPRSCMLAEHLLGIAWTRLVKNVRGRCKILSGCNVELILTLTGQKDNLNFSRSTKIATLRGPGVGVFSLLSVLKYFMFLSARERLDFFLIGLWFWD